MDEPNVARPEQRNEPADAGGTPPARHATMNAAATIAVPAPWPHAFEGGITHPDLWLWDAWTYEHASQLVLFTLAIARHDAAGRRTTPGTRNDYPFHVRQFRSSDGGRSWHDHGAVLRPSHDDGVAGANVWSGSALGVDDQLLFGFTGIRRADARRNFIQSICLIETRPLVTEIAATDAIVLSDPVRDYDRIVERGYYLGPKADIGADGGEEGGPILAWRDPFFVREGKTGLRAYWAAKVGPAAPAVAHARLERSDGHWRMAELLAPMTLPDAAAFTQAEVPKVYPAPGGGYLMLVSTCDRFDERQPDAEVTKELRLYRSDDLGGPWEPFDGTDSRLDGVQHLFGGSFSAVDEQEAVADLIAPYTEMAEPCRQLTFAPRRQVSLRR